MLANAFLLACRQIWRNPMRSLLTVLGIVIGVAAVITMVTVGNGTTTSVREQIESLGGNQLVLRPGQRLGPGGSAGAPAFKLADIKAIENQVGGVVSVAPRVTRTTSASSVRPYAGSFSEKMPRLSARCCVSRVFPVVLWGF